LRVKILIKLKWSLRTFLDGVYKKYYGHYSCPWARVVFLYCGDLTGISRQLGGFLFLIFLVELFVE